MACRGGLAGGLRDERTLNEAAKINARTEAMNRRSREIEAEIERMNRREPTPQVE